MQRIVTQLASLSYSPLPALPAPRIAGLLPARVDTAESKMAVVPRRQSRLERQQAIWAAQDAEIESFLQGARQRLANVCTQVVQEIPKRPAFPFLWELAS